MKVQLHEFADTFASSASTDAESSGPLKKAVETLIAQYGLAASRVCLHPVLLSHKMIHVTGNRRFLRSWPASHLQAAALCRFVLSSLFSFSVCSNSFGTAEKASHPPLCTCIRPLICCPGFFVRILRERHSLGLRTSQSKRSPFCPPSSPNKWNMGSPSPR